MFSLAFITEAMDYFVHYPECDVYREEKSARVRFSFVSFPRWQCLHCSRAISRTAHPHSFSRCRSFHSSSCKYARLTTLTTSRMDYQMTRATGLFLTQLKFAESARRRRRRISCSRCPTKQVLKGHARGRSWVGRQYVGEYFPWGIFEVDFSRLSAGRPSRR